MSTIDDDRKLLTRIDQFGKGLSRGEIALVESFLKWVAEGRPLTDKQRRVALDIDDRRVGA